MADWSKDNPASIRGMRDADEREDAERTRREKSIRTRDAFLGACVLCGDARFTGNNRGEQPRCMNTVECARRCRQLRR